MDEGTVLHTLMLGKGAELCVFDVKDFRAAEVRRARDAGIVAGRMVLKEFDCGRLSVLCRSTFDHGYPESAAAFSI